MSVQKSEIRNSVEKAVLEAPIVDMHTHLYPPSFNGLLLWGIDELLTYHYLIAEVMRTHAVSYEDFWKLNKSRSRR